MNGKEARGTDHQVTSTSLDPAMAHILLGTKTAGDAARSAPKRGFDSVNGNEHSNAETDRDYIKGNGVSRAE